MSVPGVPAGTDASPPGVAGAAEQELPFAPGVVEDMLKMLARAVRARQLYLPNNPMYQRAIDMLRAAFAPLWRQTDELRLAVTESQLIWEGRAVLEEPSRGESLPWTFYKDGMRELTLLPGVEADEIVVVLDLIQRVRRAAGGGEDLLTLFWEQDFLHLRYRYVDIAQEISGTPEASPGQGRESGGLAEDASRVREAVAQDAASPAATNPGIVRMEDFDAALYFLDDHEVEYLRTAVAQEYQQDLRTNVAAILLDVFEVEASGVARDEVVELLGQLLLHYLSLGDFASVAYLVRETRAAAERAKTLTPEHKEKLLAIPARLSAAESLDQLLQLLDEAPEPPPQEELNALFDVLDPRALGPVLSSLGRLHSPRVREALERAAARLASASTGELVRLIGSDDLAVAKEAARRAGELRTPAAVAPLGKLLEHDDAPIRLVAAQALAEIASPGALQQLERAIEDASKEVRVAAVRAVGSRGHRAALPRVDGAIKGKALREADLTEKLAYFEAYALLAGGAGVDYLDGLLNAKGLFRREDPEIRACAALALGRVKTPEAIEALRKASDDKELVVRNAVMKAMRGGAA